MTASSIMFCGVQIRACEHLPKTKTITWRTERKWCHWKGHSGRKFKVRTKEIPCEMMLMFNGGYVVSPETMAKIELQLHARRVTL